MQPNSIELERKNYRESENYALENSNFRKVGKLEIIQATQHQDNVQVNARGRRVDVSGSYGAACLSCCLAYMAAMDPNLFSSDYFDIILQRDKYLLL